MRDAVARAQQASNVAGQTAGQYGATAAGIGANLLPFATRQLTAPSGISQRDQTAEITNAMAGAGGATSGLYGAAGKMATVNRNPMGFSSALDAAARERARASAGAAEGVAAKNTDVKLGQQNQAASILSGLYGVNANAQLGAQRNQTADIDAEINADRTGWAQNLLQGIGAGADLIKAIKMKG